jgi:hypothetical protein
VDVQFTPKHTDPIPMDLSLDARKSIYHVLDFVSKMTKFLMVDIEILQKKETGQLQFPLTGKVGRPLNEDPTGEPDISSRKKLL